MERLQSTLQIQLLCSAGKERPARRIAEHPHLPVVADLIVRWLSKTVALYVCESRRRTYRRFDVSTLGIFPSVFANPGLS